MARPHFSPDFTLASPLGEDLRFHAMTHESELGKLGSARLTLLSAHAGLAPQALLGQAVTVTARLRRGLRFFHGYITRFCLAGHEGRHFRYEARMCPWPWFLTRASDCRIFQDLSVPDIVKAVFQDHAVADFEFRLSRRYRTRSYCVQYRETDFDFVQRLLADEGIYWHMQDGEGRHTLVLQDDPAAHDDAPGCNALPYAAAAAGVLPDTECISAWEFCGDGGELPAIRVEEEQSWQEHPVGRSTAHGMATGACFGLRCHPRADQNRRYLCVAATIQARVDGARAGSSAGGHYCCDFKALPVDRPFRPPPGRERPFMRGPQTAVVTGPAGQEIHTDRFGRVKVQFHWDRQGGRHERTSCWVRVASPWAGGGLGCTQVPRVGQEVIVDFLEGDADQPIITGQVCNGSKQVAGNESTGIGGRTQTAGGNHLDVVRGAILVTSKAGNIQASEATGALLLQAAKEIAFQVGSSTIVMTAEGAIRVVGPERIDHNP